MRGCDLTLIKPSRASEGTIKRLSTLFFANQKLDRGRKCFYRRHICDYPSSYGHSKWLLVSRNLTSQPYFSLALVTGSLGSLLGLQQEVLCFSIHMVSTSALIHPIRGSSHLYVSPVEAFATGIKNFDQQKRSLGHPFKSSWLLDFLGIKGQIAPAALDPLIFAVRKLPWPLDRLALIA